MCVCVCQFCVYTRIGAVGILVQTIPSGFYFWHFHHFLSALGQYLIRLRSIPFPPLLSARGTT